MSPKVQRKGLKKAPAEAPNAPDDSEEFDPIASTSMFSDVEMKDDDYVRVLRRDDYEKTMVFHGRLSPTEASSDTLATLFGGGFYKCYYFQRDDRGTYVIRKQRTMKIPGPYKPPKGELPGIGAPAGVVSGAAQKSEVGTLPSPGDINNFLNATVMTTFMDLIKTMKEVSTRPTPTTDPMLLEMIRSQGAVQTKIIELIAGSDKGESKKELLEMLATMKELMTPPAGAATPGGAASTVSDMVKGMKELMGLKDIVEGKEGTDPESLMWGAAMKALETLPVLMGKGNAEKPAAVPSPGGPPALPPGTPKWKVLLLVQKKRLIEAASYGLDPATAAETALTFLPQQMHGVLHEFLSVPDHVNLCLQTIPELDEFKQWTEDFFKELHAQFMGEGADDAEEGSERKAGDER